MSSSVPDVKKPTAKPAQSVQEFSIQMMKKTKARYNLMRFNAGLDFKEWQKVRMHRENNKADPSSVDEEIPKFGAGSEYGRDARKEARKRRFGWKGDKYRADNQPWIMNTTTKDKNSKMFKGIKEGGAGENAAYYIFKQKSDSVIEAFPLHEWYKFQAVQRYKTLTAEEAEEAFNQRDKVLNYFNVMIRKKINKDQDDTDEELLEPKKKIKEKRLKISEMDDWANSDDDSDCSDSDRENKKRNSGDKNLKKKKKANSKKKRLSDDEAFEESDDGDEEGRECEYISDSSASDSELEQMKEVKSVSEEKGLKRLLASDEEEDSSDDEQKDDKNKEKDEIENSDEEKKDKNEKSNKKNDKSKNKTQADNSKINSNNSSEVDSGSDQNKSPDDKSKSSIEMRKRPLEDSPEKLITKKPRSDLNAGTSSTTSYISGSSDSGITIEAVSRYLQRKPMTVVDLLKKFKSKKTGLEKEELVSILGQVLAKIKPKMRKINGVTYYTLRA